jgi:hypothetical protein
MKFQLYLAIGMLVSFSSSSPLFHHQLNDDPIQNVSNITNTTSYHNKDNHIPINITQHVTAPHTSSPVPPQTTVVYNRTSGNSSSIINELANGNLENYEDKNNVKTTEIYIPSETQDISKGKAFLETSKEEAIQFQSSKNSSSNDSALDNLAKTILHALQNGINLKNVTGSTNIIVAIAVKGGVINIGNPRGNKIAALNNSSVKVAIISDKPDSA